ncbi:hypothetical protein [Gordonia rhizosphera]|uniref:Uncharacterized protein n=1 Tax=Gordonia rhizosphera NBRC 16068 TaxID=1108045 RepID=K6WH25_9ACTN|nr:hypothetical protein [Gordonia rhizosphera]GAB91462.1 hypothetical protein GORHZ_135_00110 [Gordonia rhizosphera NBRC 16068]
MAVLNLRGLYGQLEIRFTPVVETVVHSDELAAATKVIGVVRGGIGARVDAVAASLLHAVNLPAGSDVRKLRRQIGDLDYEVRRLRRDLIERSEDK